MRHSWRIIGTAVVACLALSTSVVNAQGQRLLVQRQISETIYHVAWSPDSQLLAVATESGARIYNRDLQETVLLDGHTPSSRVDWVSWKPDGTQLVTVGFDDPSPIIWDRDIGTNTFSLNTSLRPSDPSYKFVNTAVWSPDGEKLALVRLHQTERFEGLLGVTEILDAETWLVENTLQDEFPFPTKDLEWDPNNSMIASAFYACDTPDTRSLCQLPTFYVADISTGTTLWSQEGPTIPYDLAWSDNKLAVGASEIYIYDPVKGQPIQTWDIDGPNINIALFLDWNSDGTRLAAANADGLVKVLDGSTGDPLLNFQITLSTSEALRTLDWSPVGDKLAIGSSNGLIELRFIGLPRHVP